MAVRFAGHRELGKLSGKVIRKGNGWCRASWEKGAGGESSWELVQFWSRGSGRFLWRSCHGMRQERPNPLEMVLLHNPTLGPCLYQTCFHGGQYLPGKVHAQDTVPALMPDRLTAVFTPPQGSNALVWCLCVIRVSLLCHGVKVLRFIFLPFGFEKLHICI